MDIGAPRMALLIGLCLLAPVVTPAEPGSAPPSLPGPPAPVVPGPLGLLEGPDDAWLAPESTALPSEPRPLARRPRVGQARANTGGPSSAAGAWVRTTLALAGVVALIALLGWGYRAVSAAPRWALRGRQAPLIELVSRTNLTPRQSLCLVRVGPRLVLLGLTPNAVHALDVIQDTELAARLLGQAAAQRGDSSSAEFAKCLAGQTWEYGAKREAVEEPPLPDSQRIRVVKSRLGEALQKLRGVGPAEADGVLRRAV